MSYTIKFTDKNKLPIELQENAVNNTASDITLFGRKRLEYGKDMNANMLHLLENFACPETALPQVTPTPTPSAEICTQVTPTPSSTSGIVPTATAGLTVTPTASLTITPTPSNSGGSNNFLTVDIRNAGAGFDQIKNSSDCSGGSASAIYTLYADIYGGVPDYNIVSWSAAVAGRVPAFNSGSTAVVSVFGQNAQIVISSDCISGQQTAMEVNVTVIVQDSTTTLTSRTARCTLTVNDTATTPTPTPTRTQTPPGLSLTPTPQSSSGSTPTPTATQSPTPTPSPSIQLPLTLNNAFAFSGETANIAISQFQLRSDGTLYQTVNTNTLELQPGQWLNGNGAANQYEVYATLVSGTLTSGTLNTWLSLGNNVTWTRRQVPSGTSEVELFLQIRRISDLVIVESANVTIVASRDIA